MHKMTKPFICLGCNQSFTGKDSRGTQTARFPLILNCAHSVCMTCIKLSAKQNKNVQCPKCQKVTHLSEGELSVESLLPDLHVVGMLSNLNRSIPRNFNLKFTPAGFTGPKEPTSPHSVNCENCNTKKAKWRCDNCAANLCIKCFDKIHKANKLFKKHHCRPIDEQSYRTIVQVGCQEHDQKALEFYCEDDDELACSHCAVTGKHCGHHLVTLLEKNQNSSEDLAKAAEKAKLIKARLKNTEKKIAAVLPNSKPNLSNYELKIRDYFHDLHCCLQIREAEMLNTLSDVTMKSMFPLETMHHQVLENINEVSAFLKDATTVINNSYIAVNAVELTKKLLQCSDLPCHLVSTEDSSPDLKVNLQLDEKFKETCLSVGTVDASVHQRFTLLSEKELPKDFCVDLIDDESTTDGDTSSLNGSCVSDANDLSSPPVVPTVEQPHSHVPKTVKVKNAKSFSQEVVYVCHIKNPGEFWIRRESDVLKLKQLENNINKWCLREENKKYTPSDLKLGTLYLVQYGNDNNWYRARLKKIIDTPEPASTSTDESVLESTELDQPTNKSEVENVISEDSSATNNGDNLVNGVKDTASIDCNVEPSSTNGIVVKSEVVEGVAIDTSTTESTSCTQSRVEISDDASAPAEVSKSWADAIEEFERSGSAMSQEAQESSNSHCKVTVQYVDYGNLETVSVARMRVIQKQFLNVSDLALQCCLWDIEPLPEGEWSEESVKMFAKLVGNYELLMRVVDKRNNILYIDLCKPAVIDIQNDAPVSVREALVFLEHAHFPNPQANLSTRRKPKQVFLSPEHLHNGLKVNVVVSHVNNPSDFYIQPLGAGARYLSDMVFELQDYYGDECRRHLLSVYVPTVGMACMAQFSLDKQWYRAQVIGLHGAGLVEVFYVDFGNTEIVPCWFLAKAVDKFLKLPAQAVHCSLADVTPVESSGWSNESVSWFKSATKKEAVMMMVHDSIPKEKSVVSLFEVTEEAVRCINGLLVIEGYANSTGTRSSFTEEKRHIPVEIKTERPYVTSEGIKHPGVKVKKKHNYTAVSVCHCEDPGHIYIHTVGKDEKSLERLMKRMMLLYTDTHPSKNDWKEGDLCVVLSDKDNKWYRGRIVGRDQASISIFYLDFGWTEKTLTKKLRVPEEDVLKDDIFAIRCHLTGLLPAGDTQKWSRLACECFQELVHTKTLYVKTKGICENQSHAVDLFLKEVKQGSAIEPSLIVYRSLADILIDEGLAIPAQRNSKNSKMDTEEDTTPVNDLDREIILPSATQEINTENIPLTPPNIGLSWLPPLPLNETVMNVMPTYVGYDGIISFHLLNQVDQLRRMSNAFVEIFNSKNQSRLNGSIREGQICVARFVLDQKWYRAEITKILDECVEVIFIDYGNREKVSIDDIRTHVAFLEVPKIAHKAVLYSAIPMSVSGLWPEATVVFMHEVLVDKVCRMHVEKCSKSGQEIQVSLFLPEDVSVLDILEEKKLIRVPEKPLNPISLEELIVGKIKNIPYSKMPELPEKSFFPVMVTQLFKVSTICMQLLKVAQPDTPAEKKIGEEHDYFLRMMEELAESASSYLPLKNPKPGMSCCGLYTFDDNWYRCLILNVPDIDRISVYYVDYGNSEVLPLERLRQLPKYFLRYPMQGIISHLHGLKPNGDDWSEEAYSNMIRLLFDEVPKTGSFVAEIMTTGSPLEVRLLIPDADEKMKLVYEDLIQDSIVCV